MGNTTNTKPNYTSIKKDVACQVEFLTREGIKKCYGKPFIVEEIDKNANICTNCNIKLDQCTKSEMQWENPSSKSALICGKCTINLDEDVKVILEPCKHILCVLCYSNIYWKAKHFSLSSAALHTCYQCNTQLLHISTDINGKGEFMNIRHSLCNLNDYVTFHHKDKVLQFADLPQINLPYHFILSSKYFPLNTPQPVQEDIIRYLSNL